MSISPELHDIVEFLQKQHPFSILPLDAVTYVAKNLEITYMQKKTHIFSSGDDNSYLYIVRTGAVDITDKNGNLAERCGEGDFFGFPSVLTEIPTHFNADTLEDTLLYILHTSTFHDIRRNHPDFDQHFVMVHSEKVLDTRKTRSDNVALTTRIRHMLSRPPITIMPQETVQSAAQKMQTERASSLLVVQDTKLIGILTDRDIRNRLVVKGLPYDTPVSEILTPNPMTIEASRQSLEAHILMSQHTIHHLPVLDDGELVGLITTTDLMRLQSSSSVHLIGEISKQNSPSDIAKILSRLSRLVVSLVDADATAYDIGQIITQVTDAVTRRLLQLAEIKFGVAPMPYAWLAFGSQGRQEQTARTDQDNGLLLARNPSQDEKAYFDSVATFVCDGLHTCGYEYCSGDVMATKWCFSLEAWQDKFSHWLKIPDPQDLLYVSIFFDMRLVEGDFELADTLKEGILTQAKDNAVFLSSMAQNALGFQPPLGFFRRFVLEKGGEHHNTLDLKHKGVTPIIDMTRVYSLAYGIDETNTTDRLKALVPTPAIATADGANLSDALEFIGYVRLQHQGKQIVNGDSPNNFVNPDELSSFERQHLKTAFDIVRRMQSTLASRYLSHF